MLKQHITPKGGINHQKKGDGFFCAVPIRTTAIASTLQFAGGAL